MHTSSASVARYRFPALLTAWPAQQVLLYGALCLTIGLLVFGIGTSLWLWQVKDWGLTVDDHGRVVAIQSEIATSGSPITLGDSISAAENYRLVHSAALARNGDRITIPFSHEGTPQVVTLTA